MSASRTDADALLWKAAVEAAGGTVSDARLALVSATNIGLKTHANGNRYALTERMWLRAAENTQSAQIDIVARATDTWTNSPTFTTDQGLTGGGTAYTDTNFNVGSGALFTRDSCAWMTYLRTSRTTLNNFGELGANAGGGFGVCEFNPRYGDGNTYYDISSVTEPANSSPADVQGFWCGSRVDSTHEALYLNENLTAFVSNVVTSGAPGSVTMKTLCSIGGGGNPTEYSTDQSAAFLLTSGLTAQAMADIMHVINTTYMTAIGANVY